MGEPHPMVARLEAEATADNAKHLTLSEVAALSTAISLKRIADAICGDPKNSVMVDGLFAIADRMPGLPS